MSLKEVTAWETSDSKLFAGRSEASKHQWHLDRKESIDEWVKQHCYFEMGIRGIAEALLDHGHEIAITLELKELE